MAKGTANRARIGLREVRALEPNTKLWDSIVTGFHARRQRSAAVMYLVHYKAVDGTPHWHTIGRHGAPWTPEMARDEARRILEEVIKGVDLAARKATVAELCDDYVKAMKAGRLLTRSGRPKKASTSEIDIGRVERHIKPLLGSKPVASLTRQDVQAFMHAVAEGKTAKRVKTDKKRGLANVRGGQGTATRAMGLLGAMLSYAVERGIRTDNPVHGVRKFKDGRKERRLSDDEYTALGKGLALAAETQPIIRKGLPRAGAKGPGQVYPAAIAAVRFLALTGWRSGEALNLRWPEIDLAKRTAVLADTKTGKSMRPLSYAACHVLRTMPRINNADLVFPPSRGEGGMSGFRSYWQRIAGLAGFGPDVTPHTLRHSFASLAGDLGYSESTIGALIGHKGHTITSRYVHAADAVLLAAADAVARRTAELMGEAPTDAVVVPLRGAG